MSTLKQFKRITLTTETTDIPVATAVVLKLDTLAEDLTQQLGIEVNVSSAIGYLLKNYAVRPFPGPNPAPEPSTTHVFEDHRGQQFRGDRPQSVIDGQIRNLLLASQKIEAIKHVRMHTGMGLKEAKDYVESGKFFAPSGAVIP